MFSENTLQEKDASAHHQINLFESRGREACRERQWLLHFNDLLEAKASVLLLNETLLEDLIRDLDEHVVLRDDGYWLALARIHELALVCAENYANNCEFSLVGDLLINPRLILVHTAGLKPVVKKRHLPLSVQFRDMGNSFREIRIWLKTKTLVEVQTEALLPDLFEKLEGCGIFDQAYLDAVEQRKRRIADLLGFLAAGGITDPLSLRNWLEKATPADRRLMAARFCPLDLDWFFEMGRLARKWGSSGAVSYRNTHSA